MKRVAKTIGTGPSGGVPPHAQGGQPSGPSRSQSDSLTRAAATAAKRTASRQPSSALRQPSRVAARHPHPSQDTPHPASGHLLPIRCGEGKSAGRGASPQSEEYTVPAGEVFLTKEAVAKRLGVKPKTVSNWANEGRLPAYRIGVYLRFKWAEVEQHLATSCRVARQKAESACRTGRDGNAEMLKRKPETNSTNSHK